MASIAGPLLLIGGLSWPMLFTSDGINQDWIRHLWFMWDQGLAIREAHHPSLFLAYDRSVFYPQYAFYGATLYTIVGLLSLLIGNAPIQAYVASYILGFAAAYGGWYWMARMAGLGRCLAHAPGVIFVTSAYYITLVYARGDFPEFIGVSMIPLVLASCLSILRAERVSLRAAIALALGGVAFFGSHNLTIVWASTFVVLFAIPLAGIPEVRRRLRSRRILVVFGLLFCSLLVNGWFLLPAIAYSSHTALGGHYAFEHSLRSTMHLVSLAHIFTPSRGAATPGSSNFSLALPTLAMAWSAMGVAVLWWARVRGPWMKVLLVSLAAAMVITVLMTHAGLLLVLPKPFSMLQFAYRLESYIALAVSGAVLAGLAAARGGRVRPVRIWGYAVTLVAVVAVVGAIQQASAYQYVLDRHLGIVSRFWPGPALPDFSDASLAPVGGNERLARISFPPSEVHDEHISETVHLQSGQRVYSNIGGGPELVSVTGARIVGVDPEGNDVLEIGSPGDRRSRATSTGSGKGAPTEVITVEPAHTLPVELGRVLSLGGLVLLLGAFVALTVARVRTRGRPIPAI